MTVSDQELYALYEISRFDPDGGDVEPTTEDHNVFAQWVREAYGDDLWDTYRNTNWRGNPNY